MIIFKLVYILMPVSIYMAFFYAPRAEILGESSRILYFHVPLAMVSALAFMVSGIASIMHLYDKKHRSSIMEDKAYNSAVIGFLFAVMTTITGSIWSKISWGDYWNWDPRQTSIVMLLLIYIAYFSLRSALTGNANKGRIASVYLIFAMAVAPFFFFVIPRIFPSLHPDTIINSQRKVLLDDKMKITLLMSLISYTLLYFYIFNLRNRISVIEQKIEDRSA
jgi:heme exporter protein C